MTIWFYGRTNEWGEFSNFAHFPFILDGKLWPTSEHYFQAQKFAGTEHEEAIRLAPKPNLAARMGRERTRPLRPDWEQVKDDVMRRAVRAKFTAHESLRELLLSTGDEQLVENAPRRLLLGLRQGRHRPQHAGRNPDGTARGAAEGLTMKGNCHSVKPRIHTDRHG